MDSYVGGWQDADFTLMAEWFGIDADRLVRDFAPTLDALYGEFVGTVWEQMETCARSIAGKEADKIPGFDFLDAQAGDFPDKEGFIKPAPARTVYDLASEKKEALPAKDALAGNVKDLAQEAPQVNDNR